MTKTQPQTMSEKALSERKVKERIFEQKNNKYTDKRIKWLINTDIENITIESIKEHMALEDNEHIFSFSWFDEDKPIDQRFYHDTKKFFELSNFTYLWAEGHYKRKILFQTSSARQAKFGRMLRKLGGKVGRIRASVVNKVDEAIRKAQKDIERLGDRRVEGVNKDSLKLYKLLSRELLKNYSEEKVVGLLKGDGWTKTAATATLEAVDNKNMDALGFLFGDISESMKEVEELKEFKRDFRAETSTPLHRTLGVSRA